MADWFPPVGVNVSSTLCACPVRRGMVTGRQGHRAPLATAVVRAHGRFTLTAPLPLGEHQIFTDSDGGEGLIADQTPARLVLVR